MNFEQGVKVRIVATEEELMAIHIDRSLHADLLTSVFTLGTPESSTGVFIKDLGSSYTRCWVLYSMLVLATPQLPASLLKQLTEVCGD